MESTALNTSSALPSSLNRKKAKRKIQKRKKYDNNKNYWNLASVKNEIENIFCFCIAEDLITEEEFQKFKRIRKGKTKLEILQEILFEKYELNENDNFKQSRIEFTLKRINYVIFQVVNILEQFEQMIDNTASRYNLKIDEVTKNYIKNKIKAAIEKYNGKWSSFVRRIKTDIFRQIKKNQGIFTDTDIYSPYDDDYAERAKEKTEFEMLASAAGNIDLFCDNMIYLTPEEYCIRKEEWEKGIYYEEPDEVLEYMKVIEQERKNKNRKNKKVKYIGG